MEQNNSELHSKLEEKRKEFVKNVVYSLIGIILFYAVLHIFTGIDIIVYSNFTAVCVIFYLYKVTTNFNFDLDALGRFGLFSFTFYTYVNVMLFWKTNPMIYLFFLPIPLGAFIIFNFKGMLYSSLAIIVLSISAPFVSDLFFSIKMFHDFIHENLKFDLSPPMLLINNISAVVFTIYLFAILLYYYSVFERLKARLLYSGHSNNTSLLNETQPNVQLVEKVILHSPIEDTIDLQTTKEFERTTIEDVEVSENVVNTREQNSADDIEKEESNESTQNKDIPNKEKLEELYDDIIRYFKENKPHQDPDFNMHKLVIGLNSNNTYISRALNLKEGIGFKLFLNTYRVKEVKERLDKGEHKKFTIKHLYSNSGFTSQSTFNRVFKEIEGITPSEYIDNLRQQQVN